MPSSSAGLFNPGTKRKHHGTTCQDITENVRHSKRLKTAARHGHDDSVFLHQQHREQRRMVLMETGVPVHDLRTYADVWTALEGGVEGLYTLHQQGFVHWDINSGNILLIGAGLEKRGVIVDLEYAKGIHDKPAPHDLKTGTATFMSVEVERSVYTHTPEIFSTSSKIVKHIGVFVATPERSRSPQSLQSRVIVLLEHSRAAELAFARALTNLSLCNPPDVTAVCPLSKFKSPFAGTTIPQPCVPVRQTSACRVTSAGTII
ncbi:hypothetical protein BDV93DRAFT_518600 [Ceratobasidium sp. AG-I]|nr:hypothetical protein BDV93DRAFT_518600 [Ceratobasidium sp. AG-I]